jgi:acyl-CoA thioesterase I
LNGKAGWAAALMAAGLAACAEQSTGDQAGTTETVQPPAPTKAEAAAQEQGPLVLAFGDSLYAGYGVLPQQSLPAVLQRELKARGVAATVRNAGVSGDTTAAGRQRLAYTLDGLPGKPDLVLLGLGGNDMLRGLPPEETEANLRAILDELKRRGIPVVLTGMVAAPNMGRAYGAQFDAIYPKLAKDYGAGLYPFILEGVVTDSRLMLPDRIHPTPAGIERIADRVAPIVAERLRSAS